VLNVFELPGEEAMRPLVRIFHDVHGRRIAGLSSAAEKSLCRKIGLLPYRQEGRSYRWIADTLGVSVGKVHSIVAASA